MALGDEPYHRSRRNLILCEKFRHSLILHVVSRIDDMVNHFGPRVLVPPNMFYLNYKQDLFIFIYIEKLHGNVGFISMDAHYADIQGTVYANYFRRFVRLVGRVYY